MAAERPLTARTRELLDSVLKGESVWAGASDFGASLACVSSRVKPTATALHSGRRVVDEVKADEDAAKLLTPRLLELLNADAPQPSEVAAVHAGLESLQNTLGAAYMLLAAETKAESLQAELTLARSCVAEHMSADDGMRDAHAKCVADYDTLRSVLDRARDQTEALVASLDANGALSTTLVRQRSQELLALLGSRHNIHERNIVADGSECSDAAESDGADTNAGQRLRERLQEQLNEAEENQRAFAAQLNSREAQLSLARSELAAVDDERERYVEIVSRAESKIVQAAGASSSPALVDRARRTRARRTRARGTR